MLPEEYQALCDSMRESGFDDTYPIVVYQGEILDGRHRYQAAIEVGVEPIFVEWEPKGDDTPEKFALRSNVRRHMTVSQRAAYVVAITGKNMTVDELADAANVSPATIKKVRKIARDKPDKLPEMVRGEVTISEAMRDDDGGEYVPQEDGDFEAPFEIDTDFMKRREGTDPITYAFQMRHEFKALTSTLTEMAKRLDELAATEVGYALKVSQIKLDMKNAKDGIKWAMPYKNCPYPSHEGCKACRGLGWVIRDVWDNIPEEIKK